MNRTIEKLRFLVFSSLIITTFGLLGMQTKGPLTFRGYMNYTDGSATLKIGTDYIYNLDSQAIMLKDYTFNVQPNGNYEKFSIKAGRGQPVEFTPSGVYKEFIIVQWTTSPGSYREMPVSH